MSASSSPMIIPQRSCSDGSLILQTEGRHLQEAVSSNGNPLYRERIDMSNVALPAIDLNNVNIKATQKAIERACTSLKNYDCLHSGRKAALICAVKE
jgi:hypothetical protein